MRPQAATRPRPRARRRQPTHIRVRRSVARLRAGALPLLVVARAAVARWWPVALAALVGLALRLAVIPSGQTLDVTPPVADEGNYLSIADSLLAGDGIPDRWIWLRPPGYPLFLAGWLRLADGDLRAPLIAQAAIGAATIALAAALAATLWGRRAAIVAAWWAALDPSLIFYTRLLHSELLYTALLTVAAIALVRYAAPGATWRPIAAAAVAAGLAALCRPAIVVALPFVALWAALRRPAGAGVPGGGLRAWARARATGLRHAALLLLLVAAVIAPNAIHNWAKYRRFIPLDTTLAYIFVLDHRDPAQTKEEVVAALAAIPNPADRQSYALRAGLAWIAANPGQAAAQAYAGLRVIWGEPIYVIEAVEKRRGLPDGWRITTEALGTLNWLLLVPLAIVGVRRAARADPLIPLGAIAALAPTIGVALSHPENRYLLPSLPIMIAVAAGAFPRAAPADPDPARARRRTLVALALVALFLVNYWQISNVGARQRLAVSGHWLLARAAERVGATDVALAQYDAMAAWDGRLAEPDERRAAIAHRRGDDDAALALALRAVGRDPFALRARVLAAQLYLARGQPGEAARLVGGAGPTLPDALAWAWDHPVGRPPAALALDGTDLGFARDFYGAESGGGRPFRWSAGRAAVRLAPPPGARSLVLTLASPRPPEEPPATVAVRANGRALGTVVVRREVGWNDLSLTLPADLADGRELTVELDAPTIRVPGDRRALGVAVARVEGR